MKQSKKAGMAVKWCLRREKKMAGRRGASIEKFKHLERSKALEHSACLLNILEGGYHLAWLGTEPSLSTGCPYLGSWLTSGKQRPS